MMQKPSTIIKKSMKSDKINFFESPHIQHFNFNNFQDARYRDFDDLQVCEERLFPNQQSGSSNLVGNPIPDIHNFLTSSTPENIQNSSFNESPEKMDKEQVQFDGSYGINQKLEYSEQQPFLAPLTPQKKPQREEYNNTATVKKQLNQQNFQAPQGRYFETGLKKLAYQAFSFVSKQKKTTYKEVANNLINQLNDMGIHKSGEMNIKRRVYDALNVLLALGLLKRNGNKIIGKKLQNDEIFLHKNLNKRKESIFVSIKDKTEQTLQNELQILQKEYKERLEIFRQKQKMVKLIKQKIDKMNLLTQRNRSICESSINVQQTTMISQKQKIWLPFIGLCLGQNSNQKGNKVNKKSNSQLRISQRSDQCLNCTFNSQQNINFIGDIDLINNLTVNTVSSFSLSTPLIEQKTSKKKQKK